MTDNSMLTDEELHEALIKLGPRPPWWRPLKRRRWFAAEYALYMRGEGWPRMLARIHEAIRALPSEDSRRRR